MIFDSFDEIFFLMYIHWEKNNTLKTAYFDFLQIWGDTDRGGDYRTGHQNTLKLKEPENLQY